MSNDRFKSITLQQMEALISLVEEGSFSRAAKKMLLTQPALTKNIQNIEDLLSVRLVNRSITGISLTAEGKIIYEYAKRLVKLRNEATQKILTLHENTGGSIYITASTIPATYILPRALSAFRKNHSDIRVYIKTADSEEAMNMVLDREAEIGCIGKKPQNKKLAAEPLWKDRLVLAVAKGHRWLKKKYIAANELREEPFIAREKGSATRDVLESYLKETKAISLSQLDVCGELGSSEAIKEAIIAGLGVSIISIHAIKRELATGLLFEVPIAGLKMERNFYLIYPRQTDFRPSHKIFIAFLKDYIPGEDSN
jgi:DNA-binding transcriptional LysR family regulator